LHETQAPHPRGESDGVRVMTLHKATGLIPGCDPLRHHRESGNAPPDRHLDPGLGMCALKVAGCAPHELLEHEGVEIDRDRARHPIAYVRATRARDLLVVPAWVMTLRRRKMTSGERVNAGLYPRG